MAFDKCSKCGRMHYATDPCKESTAALMEVQLDHQSSGNNMLAKAKSTA